MTSTYILKNLHETMGNWTYSTKGATLGGMEDRYVRISGNCHPDFISVPIGNANGTKLCVRKPQKCDKDGTTEPERQSWKTIEDSQGYNRGCVNLYDVHQKIPTQQINPYYYADRRTPYESDLLRRGLLYSPLTYNGTGIGATRIPTELEDTGKPYFSYGYSFTPREDPDTGMRVATSLKQTVPVPKYDVTRLHQPYPIWKNESAIVRNPQDNLDTRYFKRIV
jgi:hypothetical protein